MLTTSRNPVLRVECPEVIARNGGNLAFPQEIRRNMIDFRCHDNGRKRQEKCNSLEHRGWRNKGENIAMARERT